MARRELFEPLGGGELDSSPSWLIIYRMVNALTRSGVTVFMTVEVAVSFSDLSFGTDLISFVTDDVIHQRYVEIEGQMRKVMTVIKMRESASHRLMYARAVLP